MKEDIPRNPGNFQMSFVVQVADAKPAQGKSPAVGPEYRYDASDVLGGRKKTGKRVGELVVIPRGLDCLVAPVWPLLPAPNVTVGTPR